MEKEQAIILLEHFLEELEASYYGGFRPTSSEDDHAAIRYAIQVLKETE